MWIEIWAFELPRSNCTANFEWKSHGINIGTFYSDKPSAICGIGWYHTTPIALILRRIPSRSKLKESGKCTQLRRLVATPAEDVLIISHTVHYAFNSRPVHSTDAIPQTLRGTLLSHSHVLNGWTSLGFFPVEKGPKPVGILIKYGRRDIVCGESVGIVRERLGGFVGSNRSGSVTQTELADLGCLRDGSKTIGTSVEDVVQIKWL